MNPPFVGTASVWRSRIEVEEKRHGVRQLNEYCGYQFAEWQYNAFVGKQAMAQEARSAIHISVSLSNCTAIDGY